MDAQQITQRVKVIQARATRRDKNYRQVIAIRDGDYDSVAPGVFNTELFDKPLVANLIDTTARDIAEVMAPLPTLSCQPMSLSNDSDTKRSSLRMAIANSYIQNCRLQDQMFGGADRYGSFGFLAYIVEADYAEQMPVIRVSTNPFAHYTKDYRGRVVEYFETFQLHPDELKAQYPDTADALRAKLGDRPSDAQRVQVVRWIDKDMDCMVCTDIGWMLCCYQNPLGKNPVRIVERPTLVDKGPKGQFDDVIWVQVARALIQMYTLNAIERSVNAPIVVPEDVQEIELGPFAAIQTKGQVSVVNLPISQGLFPEQQALAMEQREGSRYPEARGGSVDASIITGQGVQALMGTFDTQVQTFQRLNSSALQDVIEMCFEMDEKLWPNVQKTQRIRDNGQPRKFAYVPSQAIAGDYTVDATYGAVAGLDPNRALVFLMQSLAGGLLSKATARRHLPVDINVAAEERQIELEQLDTAMAASLAAIPQVLPQMVAQGADPRELVTDIVAARKLVAKGSSPAEALEQVFAPKQPPADQQAQAAQPGPPGAPGQPPAPGAGPPGQGGPGASMLQFLAGQRPNGQPQLAANVSRSQPIPSPTP